MNPVEITSVVFAAADLHDRSVPLVLYKLSPSKRTLIYLLADDSFTVGVL